MEESVEIEVFSSSLPGNMIIESNNDRLKLLLDISHCKYKWNDLIDNKEFQNKVKIYSDYEMPYILIN